VRRAGDRAAAVGVTMQRRSFLAGLLAAPAIVRASSLMPLYVPPLVLYGDGIHDDTQALSAALTGERVRWADGRPVVGALVSGGAFLLSDTVRIGDNATLSNAHLKWVGEWDASKHLLHAGGHGITIEYSILRDDRVHAPMWSKQMMYVDG
jgi:hypothetical protein